MSGDVNTTEIIVLLAPLLALAGLGLLLLLLEALFPRIYGESLVSIALAGMASAVFLAFAGGSEIPAVVHGMIKIDPLAVAFLCLIALTTSLTLMISLNACIDARFRLGLYSALVIFAATAAGVTAASVHWVSIFVGAEMTMFFLAALFRLSRYENGKIKPPGQLIFYTAAASSLLALGITLILISSEAGSFDHLTTGGLQSVAQMGLALVIAALALKIFCLTLSVGLPISGLSLPAPLAAFATTVGVTAFIAPLLRIMLVTDLQEVFPWQEVIGAVAILAMIVGNAIAWRQQNLKQLLGSSTLVHAGYLLVGLAAGNEQGYASVLFYILVFGLINLGAYGVIALQSRADGEAAMREDIRGLAYRQPFAAAAMGIFVLALVGLPITAGFMSKFFSFSAAMTGGHWWLVAAAALSTLISIKYYFDIIAVMFMEFPPALASAETEKGEGELRLMLFVRIALGLALVATVVLGVAPARWLEIFQSLVRSLH